MKNIASRIITTAQNTNNINSKSYGYQSNSFVDYLFRVGKTNLSFYQCIQYYMQCSPLFSSIQLIADEIASITPYLYDNINKQYKREGDLLNLLYNPNMDTTGAEFLEQIAAFYLITGNCYIVATGQTNKPAKELFVIPPQYVVLNPAKDGFTDKITITSNYLFTGMVFERKDVDGRNRYYNGDNYEIWHMKEFNPLMGVNFLYGMPKLMPIFYEIEQYLHASVHNLSLLSRGARPSGALVAQTPLSDDQFMRLQEEMDRFYTGSNNAGRILLLENGVDFKEMSITNKDMDFAQLKNQVTYMIYNTLKIPLPLISPEHTSMNNMEISKLNLYDNAVLPLLNRIFYELSNFLMHRYPSDTGYEISYSPEEITALEPRRNDELNKIKTLGVLTVNELRAKMGYEPLDGGDSLFGTVNEVPIATDTYIEDMPKQPAPSSKEWLYNTLRKQKNTDGTLKYTEDRIKEIVQHYYGI